MNIGTRIHRKLWVEELEPRVAPATLSWVGDVVTLHQGDRVTISVAEGGDFDGDQVDIVVDSLTGDLSDTTAEVMIRRAFDPDLGGTGYYIEEISFAQADENTRLTVYVGGSPAVADTGTVVGNINDDLAVDANGNPLPLTVGAISIEGTVGDVRLGGIDSSFRSWGEFTADACSHFDEDPALVPYTVWPDSVNSIVLDGGVGFDGQVLIDPVGTYVGAVWVGGMGGQGCINVLTIEGGDFGATADVDAAGSIRHFTLGNGDMIAGSTLHSDTAIDEVIVYGNVEAGVAI